MSDSEILSPVSPVNAIGKGMSDDEVGVVEDLVRSTGSGRENGKATHSAKLDSDDEESTSTNNGFGEDGEPDYKPRKDSSSDSSEEEEEEQDEISAPSSKSRSSEAEPPKPKSRSASINHSAKDDDASDDTDDESHHDLPKDVPVPVARKVSVPQVAEDDDVDSDVEERRSPLKQDDSDSEHRASPMKQSLSDESEAEEGCGVVSSDDEDDDIRASPLKKVESEDEDELASPVPRAESDVEIRRNLELTNDELELSKRETLHIADDEPVVHTNGRLNRVPRDASLSSDSEDEKKIVNDKSPSPRRSLNLYSGNDDQRSPSPNVPKLTTDGSVTKAYMAALNNNNTNGHNGEHEPVSKTERPSKPVKDITQLYVDNIARSTPPASPKPVARAKPAKDITQLYTGKIEQTTSGSSLIADKLSPKKHNMSTSVDKDEIRKAYDDVRSDTSETEWAVFKFDGNSLGVTATGNDFGQFKSFFGNDDRGFGYIRIKTGDEMSKRSKFVFVTWVGPTVSVMKKAKMSTDKALMKDIIQNLSVELQLENHAEFNHDYFKNQVDKAAGARYGTGVRDV